MVREDLRARQRVIQSDAPSYLCPKPLDDLPGYAYACDIMRDQFDIALFMAHTIDCPTSIRDSVLTRQAEFFAGRLAAQKALSHLGFTHYPIALQEDRTPGWPPDTVGSISHNKHHAVACVRRSHRDGDGLGLDIEDMMSDKTAKRLADYILNNDEYVCLERGYSRNPARCVTLAFSAKESLFKALYASVRSYFDFLDVRIVAANLSTLTLQLTRTLSPQRIKGTLFKADIHPYRSGILTCVDLECPPTPSVGKHAARKTESEAEEKQTFPLS